MSSQKDALNALGEQLKGLDPEKGKHEIESIKNKIINIICNTKSQNFYKGFVSLEYMADDIVEDALTLMLVQRKELDKYDPEKSSLSYYITDRIQKRIREVEKKEKNKHYIKEKRENDDADTLKDENEEKKKEKIVFTPPDSLDQEITSDEGSITTLGDRIKSDQPDTDEEAISKTTKNEPIFQLASLIINFTNKPSGKENLQKKRHYYELFYTEALVDDLKIEKVTRYFRYIHERDIIEAVFLQYLNFMLAKKPDGSDKFAQKAEVSSTAIGLSHLELIKNVRPSDYTRKGINIEQELSIPISPFVLRGYFERKERTPVSQSRIDHYKKAFKADVLDIFKEQP